MSLKDAYELMNNLLRQEENRRQYGGQRLGDDQIRALAVLLNTAEGVLKLPS